MALAMALPVSQFGYNPIGGPGYGYEDSYFSGNLLGHDHFGHHHGFHHYGLGHHHFGHHRHHHLFGHHY